MKNRPGRNLRASLLALACTATAAVAALTPTEWQYRQALQVPAPGVVSVSLTPAAFDAAGPQQEDLRVIDPAGHEVASLLAAPAFPTALDLPPAPFEMKLAADAALITITTGTKEPLSSVSLMTPQPFFMRAARVEISDDGAHWTTLDQGLPLFRQWGAEKLDLPLGNHTAAYVRVTVSNNRDAALPVTGTSLHLLKGVAPPLIPVGSHLARRDEFVGDTLLTLELDGRHLPLAALEFATKEPLFMRRVTVAVREVRDGVSGERVVGAGTIFRVALDGAPPRTQLELPLHFATPAPRELLVHIHNGDSPPLAIDGVGAKRDALELLFMAPTAGTYRLLSGNPQARPGHYDLAGFAGEMFKAKAAVVVPGELEPTPDYHPRESLAEAPLPDVPLTGAPLEAKDWTERRTLTLARPGVQELELDLEALARSRSDFADLRVVRAGNQIPYVLERPALARSLALVPVAAPDPKRPNVSVWQLPLPQSGPPLRRLVLTSTTPLFEREIRISEKIRAADGSVYQNLLASGRWSRTPEPSVPETRVFELGGRLQTDTLWIETDNGDNPAIALGPVQAVYPVVRLVFKVADPDGFALIYGHPTAVVPRYDLSLVAVKLLTASRSVAKLAASEPHAASRNPFAGLNGGYVFWGALALVVVVLLLVVAKLLPKPPA